MQIKIETSSYNEKRYGKPWIAKVNFVNNPNGDFQFGKFVGDVGCEGLLIIDADPGDVVAKGQKDHRAKRLDPPVYYVVKEDGALEKLSGKKQAYEAYMKTLEAQG